MANGPFGFSRREGLSDGMSILGAIKLQATPRSVADVRSYLSGLLADGPADVATVVLLASELATNSLRHTAAGAEGTIAVAVLAVGDAIRVEVADGGASTTPCLRVQDDEYADGGRGLHLVDLLAARWGFTRDRDGTTTWFEIATSCDDTTCPEQTLN